MLYKACQFFLPVGHYLCLAKEKTNKNPNQTRQTNNLHPPLQKYQQDQKTKICWERTACHTLQGVSWKRWPSGGSDFQKLIHGKQNASYTSLTLNFLNQQGIISPHGKNKADLILININNKMNWLFDLLHYLWNLFTREFQMRSRVNKYICLVYSYN